ncbi:hypothetical protein Hanom_Chr05g00424021 [Helianthus anomalus]
MVSDKNDMSDESESGKESDSEVDSEDEDEVEDYEEGEIRSVLNDEDNMHVDDVPPATGVDVPVGNE